MEPRRVTAVIIATGLGDKQSGKQTCKDIRARTQASSIGIARVLYLALAKRRKGTLSLHGRLKFHTSFPLEERYSA